MTLLDFLNTCELEATEAKKKWNNCSMHPNDMCEEVLKLVKMWKAAFIDGIPTDELYNKIVEIIND